MFRFTDNTGEYGTKSAEEIAGDKRISVDKARERIAHYKPIYDYIEPLISDALIKGLDDWGTDELYTTFTDERFFKDVGVYFGMSDDKFGHTFFARKIERMKEKLMDREKAYDLDLFEEWILGKFLSCVELCTYENKNKETMIRARMLELGCNEVYAGRMAAAAARLWPMEIGAAWSSDEEENNKTADETSNAFFPNEDYMMFDTGGFAEIMNIIAIGYSRGYGWDYAGRIFTDAGYEVPILFIGSEEAARAEHRYLVKNLGTLIIGGKTNKLKPAKFVIVMGDRF